MPVKRIFGNFCKIGPKVCFIDRKEQPVKDGIYDVEIIGQNPKGTVNFLHIKKAYVPYMEGDTYVSWDFEGLHDELVEIRVPNGWSFRQGTTALGHESFFVFSYNGKQTCYRITDTPDTCPIEVLEQAGKLQLSRVEREDLALLLKTRRL